MYSRQAIEWRDVVGAARAFDEAANAWLAERIGQQPPDADAAPARWRNPAPPQSGPDGEAADRR
eukprot:4183423-Lingulodinium_polyedra.AAC.1